MRKEEFIKSSKEQNGYVDILVSRKQVEDIANRYELSEHAKMRLVRRGGLKFDIKQNILNCALAWKTKNKSIAVAIDLFRYIVVSYDNEQKKPVVLTMVDTKGSGMNVVDKMLIEYREAFNR